MRFLMALILLSVASPAIADAQQNPAERITCENPRGSRVQYANNPISPPDQYQKFVVADDAIDGLRVEITFSQSGTEASLVMYGNKNTGGRVTTMSLLKIVSNDFISFVGRDEDGAIYLLSFYPRINRLIWSAHNDRIWYVDDVATGKIFMFSECHVTVL
ncbi:MAG: hypothetical protein WCF16_10575 [Alphaproteobacteria bacterium]